MEKQSREYKIIEARVSISVICGNIQMFRNITKRKFCAVVKANAYGHGLALSSYIEPYVDSFAVATKDEALELKQLNIQKPIYILGGGLCFEKDIISTVYTLSDIKALVKAKAEFSIKLNTGMNRMGADSKQAATIFKYLKRNGICAHSTFSHFYNAPVSAYSQLKQFQSMIKGYENFTGIQHICASNALALTDYFYLDMIRAGIGMYGYGAAGLIPAMEVCARIVQIFNVKKGMHIGYGDFTADKDYVVATIRAGYGDGLRRSTKTRYVSINGKKCRILGQCCMDMTMIDVSGMDIKINDEVFILGRGIDAYEIAEIYDTIVYEVLCGFNERVKRIYI